MIKSLISRIQEIINDSELSKTLKSNKIMECFRGDTIFISNSYKDEFKENNKCTIDPDKCLKIDLAKIEVGTDDAKVHEWIKDGIIAIKGNSLGPFFPEEYFKDDTFRIIWILKESYIEKDSYTVGDRGGHNQAAEFATYGISSDEMTHRNIIDISRVILEECGKICADAKDEEVMKHICLLEVNHFPGLAFKSKKNNDKLIEKWYEKDRNGEMIKHLIPFYSPNIVIGGHTLGHFFPAGYRYSENHNFNYIEDGIKENINMLGNIGYTTTECTSTGNYLFKTEEGCVFIDAYHPCIKSKYPDELVRKDISEIMSRKWLDIG